jgi:predicted NBD/HSP70 family sugar kinase
VTGGGKLLKRLNRMALVRLVKASPGLSRAELAKGTGLTKSTVSVLVNELIAEGWLREGRTTSQTALGRRPTPLALDPGRLALLGAELGVDYLNVVACNLRGEILASRAVESRPVDAPRTLQRLCAMVAEAHGALRARRCRPLGVGVALPGMIDTHDGRLRFAPNIGWHDVDVVSLFHAGLEAAGCRDLPFSFHNDANAAAIGQHVFGSDAGGAPLVYLHLGVGLGGGIVLGDRLYLGADGLAGEVGHTILHPEGPSCACGRRGCAETFISQRAVSRAITGRDAPLLSIRELAARVKAGDPATLAAVARASDYLGLLLQTLCYTVNPAVIVLGGPLAELGDVVVKAGVEAMRARGGRYDNPHVEVRRCSLGLDACAVGAAGAVFQQFLQPET